MYVHNMYVLWMHSFSNIKKQWEQELLRGEIKFLGVIWCIIEKGVFPTFTFREN